MTTSKTKTESGIARLGAVEALATWTLVGDCLEIRFDDGQLSPEQQEELCHYRTVIRPMALKLPRHRLLQEAAVIGYDRTNGTLFVSLATA